MTRRLKQPLPAENSMLYATNAIVQIKVWLLGVSPIVWRRVLVPSDATPRELYGVFQVVMGWEGIHLYQFCLRTARYGLWKLSAPLPDVTLAALQFRKGVRFVHEYNLSIPWRHEVHIDRGSHRRLVAGKAYPACIGGGGACPPEDSGGPAAFMAGRDGLPSLDPIEDLETMAEIVGQVALERRAEVLGDDEMRWRLASAIERSQARERTPGRPFSRRAVNTRLHGGEQRDLMYQQC
jgi:hypothetical protein